ncbi:MAG: hemerythrin domain-containing protein [Chloroflexota bacterium]|nr:hemerythrin domain-containing protein [Chloroflexota bacterium]
MEDSLTVIDRIRAEHDTIRDHVKLVGESVSDEEALASLRRTRSDWIPGRSDIVAEKQKTLGQMLKSLDEGLTNHFELEESLLPPLLGEVFMRGLAREHSQIMDAVNEAMSVVATAELEGLEREQLLSRESQMQQMIDNLSQLIADHAAREEALLSLLERGLREE